MQTLITVALAALTFTSDAAPQTTPSLSSFSGGLGSLYQSIRRNVVEAAERMPEEHFAFKPTPDVRSFGELVGHITNTHYNFCAPARGENRPATPNHETLATKAELVAALKASIEFCDRAYDHLDDQGLVAPATFGNTTVTRGYLLTYNIAHDNEHYGNMVTYFRLKGLVPPSTARTLR